MTSAKRILLVPDIQVPYHDKRLVATFTEFIRRYKPDELHQVGDLVDMPQPSRWSKGLAGEYEPTLQRDLDTTVALLADWRQALGKGKPLVVKTGNHDERLESYVARYAPALSSLGALRLDALLHTEELGVRLERRPYQIAPGWVLAHGHESGLRSTPGLTALALAKKFGCSVVCGHTHRAAIVPSTTGVGGRTTTIYGLEIGNFMQMSKAGYLTAGSADWQSAFAILHVDGTKVHPQLIFVAKDGSFVVDGTTYGGAVK
jgi:predicted phosphodiesterase